MSFYKRLAAKGGKLMLCEMHPQLATVIRLARLERQMPVYPSRAQALTGRTPALTGLITTTALAGLAGIGLTAKLLTDSQLSIPRLLATLYLLANLPQLPEDMEYRVVGSDLVLRDVDANIIVDLIPNASKM